MPAPCIGTSPAPRALVPFHAESSLWSYLRAQLDDRGDIVDLDYADTSSLSGVIAFECNRPNARNGAKHSERDLKVFGKTVHNHKHSFPSEVPVARLAAASPSLFSQSGAGSSVKPDQPNNSASTLVKTPEPSPSNGGPSTAPPSSNNISKAMAKCVLNGPNGRVSNGAAVVKSAAGAAIVKAALQRAHLNVLNSHQ